MFPITTEKWIRGLTRIEDSRALERLGRSKRKSYHFFLCSEKAIKRTQHTGGSWGAGSFLKRRTVSNVIGQEDGWGPFVP